MTDDLLPLDWRGIVAARTGVFSSGPVFFHDAIGSTNVEARALLRAGAPSGSLVLADEQTEGRGRLGRRWAAPPRSGLALSLCLRLPASFPLYTAPVAAVLAVGAVVRDVVGDRATLKWPNDVLVDGLKVSGILIEVESTAPGWSIVVGVGLNVYAAPDLPNATALAAHTMAPLSRETLATTLLATLDREFVVAASAPSALIARWGAQLATIGQHVRVQAPTGPRHGFALGVDAEGALLLQGDDGSIATIHAGDIVVDEISPPMGHG